MNQAIAAIIKGHIEGLDFVDKIAGLVSTTYMTIDGVQKSFPIACCVTADDCKEGAYNDLCPDSKYKTIIYFEDGGVSFDKYESNWKYYTSNLRLVCWINVAKILGDSCNNGTICTLSSKLIADIIRALPAHPENHSPFDFVYSEVINQVVRSNSIFANYTFNELQTQFLMYPYDYFALDITTHFAICLKGTDVYTPCATENSKYGLLYNWFAATDAREITSAGWHIPTNIEVDTLITYLGGELVAGGKLKEVSTIFWNSPNVGATNEVGFNARGTGYRQGGVFSGELDFFDIWCSVAADADNAYLLQCAVITGECPAGTSALKVGGTSLRPIKDSTSLTHGQTGTYTGNDGKTYHTICIGTQEWVSENIAETKYRNGDAIAEVTDNAAWVALATGAMCAYENDWDNV